MEKPVPFQCRHRRGGAGVPWLVALFLGLLLSARAELQFDVFVGYGLGASDGVVAEASWFPVTCEIFNDGPGFDGVVELAGSQSGLSSQVPVELPRGTRKRILVPLYASGRWVTLDARLHDSRGRVLAKHEQLRPRLVTDRHSRLIGSLSRTLGGAVVLPEPAKPNSQLQSAVARLSSELFPDNPIALEGLSTLYLHSAKAAELKPSQVTALLAWLHGGGHLVVAVEQTGDLTATPWLRTLLPCDLIGVTPRPPNGVLQAWLASDSRRPAPGQVQNAPPMIRRPVPPRGRPPGGRGTNVVTSTTPAAPVPQFVVPAENVPSSKPEDPNPFLRLEPDPRFESAAMPVVTATLRDGQVVLGSDQAPLGVQCVRGRGTLTVLLFSPELEPFKSWQHKAWFWAKLADVPIEWLAGWTFQRISGSSIDGVFGALIDSKQIRKLPVGWLFALLLAYLAVIGPVDQYVLKRINKQMLTWITFPAYVVFFSVLIYYIGYRLRAGETEWNELHVVDVIPHGERADLRGHTYGSIYSPANAQYPVASEAPYATLRGERDYYGQELSKAAIEQRGNTYTARLHAPIWTSQLFLSDWWRQSAAPLKVTLIPLVNNQSEVKIENLTGKRIPQARLVLAGRVHDLGELPRNKTFVVNHHAGTGLREFTASHSSAFQQAINERRSQFGGNRAPYLPDHFAAAAAASFVSQAGSPRSPAQNQFQQQVQSGVVASRDFDLGPTADRGDAILLAWMPGETLLPTLNKFTPRRASKDTMLRVVVPAK